MRRKESGKKHLRADGCQGRATSALLIGLLEAKEELDRDGSNGDVASLTDDGLCGDLENMGGDLLVANWKAHEGV